MSKIALSGNASGTGTLTIAAPNTSTDRTLTLPDSSGTMATAESTLIQFNASGSAPVYAARVWVNFNGTGTVAIRASGNVSSVIDLGVGVYDVNFVTALPDANFSALASFQVPSWTDLQIITYEFFTNRYRIGISVNTSGSGADAAVISSAVFR